MACVVADEVHLVGDTDRGYVLEGLLTKVLLHNKVVGLEAGAQPQHTPKQAQIIAMSATMPNTCHIAEWLDAVAFRSDHRPRPLERLIVVSAWCHTRRVNRLSKRLHVLLWHAGQVEVDIVWDGA